MHCKSLWIKASAKCIHVNVIKTFRVWEGGVNDERIDEMQFVRVSLSLEIALEKQYLFRGSVCDIYLYINS